MSTVFDLSPPPNSPQAQPPYKAPPVTVILTVVLLVFFFAGFFSIYLCRYLMGNMNNSSNSRGTQSGNAAQPTGSASNGLNPSIIATFPTLVYSSVKDLRQDKNDVECAVCLLEFQDNDELRLLTVCNHVFHSECIDLWFGNHTTCPLCRRSLLPPENNVADPPPDPPPENNNNNQQENETREDNNSVSTKDDEEEVVVVVVEGGDSHEEGTTSGAMASQDGGQQHGEDVVERFSRCHSTGHSIIHVEPDDHRYTLRLPDRLYVKDHIAMGHNWTRSCTTFGEFYGNSSSRKASGLAEFSGFSGINVTRV